MRKDGRWEGRVVIGYEDLRHTFTTMALENGMDIKTLSAALGHISSETTIDVYSHITDKMRQQSAVRTCTNIMPYFFEVAKLIGTDSKIDCQISGAEAEILQIVDTTQPEIEPYKPKIRQTNSI